MIECMVELSQKIILGLMLIFAVTFLCCLDPASAAPNDTRLAELKKEADIEGKVVFYTSILAPDAMALVEKFQKKYPSIKVDLYRLNNTGILTRMLAERNSKKNTVDVIDLKGDAIHGLQKNGLLSRYLSPERDFFPERFKDKEGYWTDVYITVHCIAYNTRMVAPNDVPATYQDLLKPRWKGKIGFNPDNYMWPEGLMQTMGKDEGLKYLEALSRQNPIVRDGGTLNTMLTAAGEVSLALPINNNNVETVKAKGAPVDWVRLKPFYGDLHPIAMAANAPHPNASKLFIDFCISQEGQMVVAEVGKIPSRSGLKSKTVRSEDINAIDPALEKTEYYQKLIRQIFVKK